MKKSYVPFVLNAVGIFAIVSGSIRFIPRIFHGSSIASEKGKRETPKQFWTCGMHPQVVQDHPGDCPICHMKLTPMHDEHLISDSNHTGPALVVIDPAVVQNMGVRTAVASQGPLTQMIHTVGTLEAPEPGLREINLKVNGWIEKLYANQDGQHVHKGDPLFDLYSSDLTIAGQELVGAERELDRLGVSADASSRGSAQSIVDSARIKLSLLDVPQAAIDSIAKDRVVPRTFTFRSPSDGAVIEKTVVEGSAVQAGTKLMRIEDHGMLWLDLQIYEEQMALVAIGQHVEATATAFPGRVFTGTITFLHPHVDHMSRTLVARAVLDNSDLSLHPGMYVTATIDTKPVENAIQVPREAVIDTGTRQLVFVVQSSGHFEPRDVRMGISGDDGRVQILEGLAAGETVVTSGQFLLDVESRTTEAIDKLRAASISTVKPMPMAPMGGQP